MSFEDAWETRVSTNVDDIPLAVIGRDALIRNKRASNRPKDRLDVEQLERQSD